MHSTYLSMTVTLDISQTAPLVADEIPRRKPSRPLYSGIPAFEDGYAAFLDDVFSRDVQNVECSETDTTRVLTLGGAHRYIVNKCSGLMTFEVLSPGSIADPLWISETLCIESFWLSSGQACTLIENAWACRLTSFIPAKENIFPPESTNAFAEGSGPWEPESKYYYMFSVAAKRRLGGRQQRSVAAKMVIGSLWNFLIDRDLLRLCQAYFGFRAGSAEYNLTARRQQELRARATETPGLTPLLGAYLLADKRLKTGRYRLPLDIVARAKSVLLTAPAAARVARLNDYRYDNRGNILFASPMSPAGWRYMASQGRPLLEAMWSLTRRLGHYRIEHLVAHCTTMNILAQSGRDYPLTFVKWLLANIAGVRTGPLPPHTLSHARDSAARFFRLAGDVAIEARKEGRLKQFLTRDLMLAFDWLNNSEQGGHNAYQVHAAEEGDMANARLGIPVIHKNATWSSVMRAQLEWHAQAAERELARREADEIAYAAYMAARSNIQWACLIGASDGDGLQILPLTSGKALIDEGLRMDHCVADYIDSCKSGTSRIFSLQKSASCATVELVKTGRHDWRVRQVFGPGNTLADKVFHRAAKALAEQYARVSKATHSNDGKARS
jgi:hypothetical protein